MNTPRKPTWWQLCVIVPMMVGLQWLLVRVPLPLRERIGAEVGLLIGSYFVIWRWLWAYIAAATARRRQQSHAIPPVNGTPHPPSRLRHKRISEGGDAQVYDAC